MFSQNAIRDKFQGLKGGVRNIWKKFQHKPDSNTAQADGIVDEKDYYSSNPDIHEFTPDTQVGTSPRTKSPLSNGSNEAQNLVWDNEDASMQDKSYSFDEVTTDADYDFEDDLNFEDSSEGMEKDIGRYR